MATSYNPTDHEGRIRARWAQARAFHGDPQRVRSGDKPPYCVLIPPPNVTGVLHLGHALNNTLQDILVRTHRMKGFETLWMPGMDHAGIATQTVVEKRILAEGGKPRVEWDRDEFIATVQAWKDEYEERIANQLRMMGCSCDWDRQRFTMDEVCTRAVREAFFRLFQAGLIERGKRLVNWDPVTQTALADDEVEMREVEGAFYYLRYPLGDASGHPAAATLPSGETIDHVTVATTRPETYLGDTAVAISPKDPRATALRGLFVRLPMVGRIIPIIEDAYVVMPDADGDAKARYATGFLKVTPAHDENDYMIGQRHGLPMINVLAPDASISDQHGWEDVGEASIFLGLSREDARKKVVSEFESRGLLEEIRQPYVHSVGHSYRSHAAIEPYLSDQWYVKVTKEPGAGGPPLAALAQRAINADQQSGDSKWLSGVMRSGVARLSEPCAELPTKAHWIALLDERRHQAVHPDGFLPRDPFPPGEPAPSDLMGSIRNLPHIELPGATYFVTWRVREGVTLDAHDRQRVLDALLHFNGERVVLYAATVLNDHLHCLVKPLKNVRLGDWIESVKKYSARTINAAHSRTGNLWKDERFDHVVRHAGWFARLVRYIVNNPVEAGLAQHPARYGMTFVHPLVWVALDVNRPAEPESPDSPPTRARLREPCHPNTRPTVSGAPGDGEVAFHPARYAKTYEDWHDNIRDWCISRQLWWGHRIPVWTQDRPDDRGPDEGDPIEHMARRDQRIVVRRSESQIHIALLEDEPEIVAEIEATGFQRDPDVLDTWFSSALWPLSTMGWPDPGQDAQFADLLDAFKPTNVLCTARDIITLWVSRMVMFNRFFEDGRVPFREVYIHPVIQDGDGKRMSKSAGNGVDPLDIISTHGADAMRFTLCGLASQTQDVRLPVERDEASGRNTSPKFDLGKRFCNKLWNASRLTLMMLGQTEPGADDHRPPGQTTPPSADLALIDRWMLSRLVHATARIDTALALYEFNVYADAIYDLLWTEFCDVYLEAIKPTVRQSPSQQAVLRTVFEAMLRLLHPVLPFVTEAIHEAAAALPAIPPVPGVTLGGPDDTAGDGLLCLAAWPVVDPGLRDEALEARLSDLQTLIRLIRDARSAGGAPPRKPATLHTSPSLAGEIAAFAGVVETLAILDRVTTQAPESPSIAITFDADEHRLSGLADEEADADAERGRLIKALADLDAAIATLEKRLENPGYTDKAPAHLVQQTRDQLDTKRAECEALRASLETLA